MFFCDNYQIQLARNSIYSRPSDKNVARFHYQDTIYLPCPQSLAMVLGVFKVIIKYQKREKGGNEKGKKACFAFPSPLALARSHYSPLRPRTTLCRTLKKPAHEAVKVLLGVRCYSPLFNAFFHRL